MENLYALCVLCSESFLPEDLSHEDKARLVVDMFHRIIIHYAFWFAEIKHQMGMEKALEVLGNASKRSYVYQMKRLSRVLGFEMKDDLPASLPEMPEESVRDLMDSVALNWLAKLILNPLLMKGRIVLCFK